MSVAAVAALVTALDGPVRSVLARFFPDKDEANKAANEVLKIIENNDHEITKLQLEIAKEAAKHTSLFVAGARPATLWICNIALVNNYVIAPYVKFFSGRALELDMTELWPLMTILLGAGAMRTYEKYKGVARENMKPIPQ